MSYTRDQIIQIITQEAQQLGVPVNLALAIANQESGFDPNNVGDGGHSIGLFQLNDQGEGYGMTVAAREDPVTNARIALTQVANVLKANPNMTPGQVAAAAQRPQDRAGYAQAIDKALGVQLSPEQYNDMSPEGQKYRDTAIAAANASASDTAGVTAAGSASGDIDGFLKSQAPELAQALGDPDVQQLLQKWGADQLSDDEFRNQLEQTSWWKNTPVDVRQNLINRATDPATAAQTFNDKLSAINTLAAQLGVGLTGAQAQQIATQWMGDSAWTSDQLKQAVAQYSKYQGDITYKGEAAVDVNTLRGIYKSMALPTDNNTLNQQLQDVLGGKLTAQDIQNQVAQQAATFYASNPQLAEYLKSGQGSVQSWAQPLISHAANILGLDPNSVDLTNPQWAFLLKPQTNAQTGQSTGMAQTLDSVEQTIKTNPMYGYSRTANGIQDYTNMINKLQATFVGGGV